MGKAYDQNLKIEAFYKLIKKCVTSLVISILTMKFFSG